VLPRPPGVILAPAERCRHTLKHVAWHHRLRWIPWSLAELSSVRMSCSARAGTLVVDPLGLLDSVLTDSAPPPAEAIVDGDEVEREALVMSGE
jgi:hypothetical protein